MAVSIRGGINDLPSTTRLTSVNWALGLFSLTTLALLVLTVSASANYWLAAAVLLSAAAGGGCVYQQARRHEQLQHDLARLRDEADVAHHILDAAGDGIVSVDEDGQVQYVNRAAARLFGYDAAELVGAGVWMLMAAPNLPGRGPEGSDLATGEAHVFDAGAGFEGKRKDGTTFPVEPAVSKTRAGQRLLYTYVIRDLTERKKAEEALRRAHDELRQANDLLTRELAERRRAEDEVGRLNRSLRQRAHELEAINAELQAFTYSVSHDLRAPLRAVSGFAQIVARRHRAQLSDEGQHYVDNIVEAAGRMGRLIDDLLEYSRLGRQGVQRQAVPLGEVLGRVAGDLAGRLRERGGQLHVAAELPAVVGDRTLLGQVFTNLLDNALTYRRPQVPPVVVVSVRPADAGAVTVAVADNGIGIAAEYYDKIFQVFQRLHSADEYPGTGIGLATVKKAVELLGGRVWVESTVGVGSTFFVTLPQAAPQDPAREANP